MDYRFKLQVLEFSLSLVIEHSGHSLVDFLPVFSGRQFFCLATFGVYSEVSGYDPANGVPQPTCDIRVPHGNEFLVVPGFVR